MGMTRRRAANTVACKILMPLDKRSLAADISTIAALTDIPDKATTPYIVIKLSGLPDNTKPKTTPEKAKGIDTNTNKGWL